MDNTFSHVGGQASTAKGAKARGAMGRGSMGRGSMGRGAMGAMMSQGMKGMEAQMRQMADTEVDLGYQGEWSGMDCAEIPIIDERLQCNYAKWEYDDPLAKSDVKRKTLNRRRKNKHAFAIRTICNEEDPFLCKEVDRDGEPSDKNFMCVKLLACPERGARLQDIPDDVKDFFKLIAELFNFNRFKSKKRKKGSSAKAKSVLEKIKMRQMKIKEDYNKLSEKDAKGAAKPDSAKPGAAKPGAAKGGGSALSKKKQKSATKSDRFVRGVTGGLMGTTGGICSNSIKTGQFKPAWKWYFSEIAKYKEALGEMKNQSLGDKHKQKEQCFGTVKDGAKKKKLLEEYHKLEQQKLKLSRGPKAALKRLTNKARKGVSKANMKMDKTIKNGKSKLSLTGSCVKTPGTKICKRDANGDKIYKPGRRPPSGYLARKILRRGASSIKDKVKREKYKLKHDPLKTLNRRMEKIALRKTINTAKTKKKEDNSKKTYTTRSQEKRNIYKGRILGETRAELAAVGATLKKKLTPGKKAETIGKYANYLTLGIPKGLYKGTKKAYRGYKGIDKQTYEMNKLRRQAEKMATRNTRKKIRDQKSLLKSAKEAAWVDKQGARLGYLPGYLHRSAKSLDASLQKYSKKKIDYLQYLQAPDEGKTTLRERQQREMNPINQRIVETQNEIRKAQENYREKKEARNAEIYNEERKLNNFIRKESDKATRDFTENISRQRNLSKYIENLKKPT